MQTTIKLCLSFLLISLVPFNLANAQSIDPYGDIYISKKSGDFSNCGPIAALMLTKFSKRNSLSSNLGQNIQYVRQSTQRNNRSNRWWRMNDLKKFFPMKILNIIQ